MLALFFLMAANVLSTNPENTVDSTVTDFDGNVYQTVTIGNQVWMKENLKSLHYADGTTIPGVVAFNNSDSMAQIYGRLYTWNAATNDSTTGTVQGVCPCGWHVPTDAEWQELENYLGGAAVAGEKLKESGTAHWSNPNIANNSSGFTALPAGEWDPNNVPNFRLLNDYAVFWTATSVSGLQARERYLKYNSTASSTIDWYKSLKYSIRCVKNQSTTNINNGQNNSVSPKNFVLNKNYPNPFNPSTTINYTLNKSLLVTLTVYNVEGRKIQTLVSQKQKPGEYRITFFAFNLPSGIYYYQFEADGVKEIGQMLLIK
jgi:uncharacterized protein (TIGR02145 family)